MFFVCYLNWTNCDSPVHWEEPTEKRRITREENTPAGSSVETRKKKLFSHSLPFIPWSRFGSSSFCCSCCCCCCCLNLIIKIKSIILIKSIVVKNRSGIQFPLYVCQSVCACAPLHHPPPPHGSVTQNRETTQKCDSNFCWHHQSVVRAVLLEPPIYRWGHQTSWSSHWWPNCPQPPPISPAPLASAAAVAAAAAQRLRKRITQNVSKKKNKKKTKLNKYTNNKRSATGGLKLRDTRERDTEIQRYLDTLPRAI